MELGDGDSGYVSEEEKVEEGQQCDKVEEMAKLKEESLKLELDDGNSGSVNEEEKVEEGQGCVKVEEMAKLKEESSKLESGDGNSRSVNEEEKVEGQQCDKVEEMAKLEEESLKPQESKSDQVEKTKGKGLKKWKRRKREPNKDYGHVQEPHRMLLKRVAPLDTSKGASTSGGNNKLKNEVIEPETPIDNSFVTPSVKGFIQSDRESDTGSWNAVGSMFPAGYSEDQSSKSTTGAILPKVMLEAFVAEDFLNEFEFGLVEPREELNFHYDYGGGVEAPLGLRAFGGGSGSGKRPAGPTKKARAEKIEGGNTKSEDSMHEHEGCSIGTERVVQKLERTYVNHCEDVPAAISLGVSFPATCVSGGEKEENLDDLGESSCSTANNLGSSNVNASDHRKAVIVNNGSDSICEHKVQNLDEPGESSCTDANNLGSLIVNTSDRGKAVIGKNCSDSIGAYKVENLDEPGESSCSDANNLGSSALSTLGKSKVMVAKGGRDVGFGNISCTPDELALWYENFDAENSIFEIDENDGSEIFEADERASVSHNGFREGEKVRENPVFHCGDVARSEASSFASAATFDAKKSDETGDSAPHSDNMHLQSRGSDCLVQALAQLQTAEEALKQEVQHVKDLGKELESLQMKDCEQSNSQSNSESNRLHNFDVPYMPNGSHVEENSEIRWQSVESQLNNLKPSVESQLNHLKQSVESQLNKLNEKLKLLQEELEVANEKILSEQTKVKELEIQCKDQEIKLKETKYSSERTTNDLQFLEEKWREMERELEEQYKGKWQAEMESLILKDAVKSNIALAEKETSLLQDQKAVVVDQLQTVLKLKQAEGRAHSLKDRLIELENASSGLLEMEEVLTLHNKVCSFSLFSFIQFILLCVAIFYIFSESPQATDLVPT